MFLWADVFRLRKESRDDYLKPHVQRTREGWHPLAAEDRERVIEHHHGFDQPAEAGRIATTARHCGWTMEWLWRGHHRAKALAVLTPASTG